MATTLLPIRGHRGEIRRQIDQAAHWDQEATVRFSNGFEVTGRVTRHVQRTFTVDGVTYIDAQVIQVRRVSQN